MSFIRTYLSITSRTLFRTGRSALSGIVIQVLVLLWWIFSCVAAVVLGLNIELAGELGRDISALFEQSFLSAAFFIAIANNYIRGPDARVNPIHYLALPVDRREIARLIAGLGMVRSLLVSFILFTACFWIASESFSAAWLVAGIALLLAVHFLVSLLRIVLTDRRPILFAGVALIAILFVITRSAERLSIGFWELVRLSPLAAVLITIGAAVLLFARYRKAIEHRLYLDVKQDSTGQAATKVFEADVSRRFGTEIAGLISDFKVELYLVLRNKRPAQLLSGIVPVILMFGFLQSRDEQTIVSVAFFAFLGTGGMMLSFGLLEFAWDGRWFDGILARPGFPESTASRRLCFLIVASAATSALVLPIAAYVDLLLPFAGVFLYNVGISAPLVLLQATFNRTTIDLSRSSFFNYQGVSIHQSLIVMVLLVVPILLCVLAGELYGWIWSGVVGLLGMAALPMWIKLIRHRLESTKYAMAEGFRRR